MHGLITLVNDNQVDNYLKEILEFVYYGSFVNNRPKTAGAHEPCHRKMGFRVYADSETYRLRFHCSIIRIFALHYISVAT